MAALMVPWKLSPPLAPGKQVSGRRRHPGADFSLENMPVLGTWVTVIQGGIRGSKARRSNTAATPALISAVSDGTVTVLYPNNLVLKHGFKGDPLKRVAGVTVDKVRRFTGSEFALQLVEKALLTAVKAEAVVRGPTTPLRRAPAAPQEQSPVWASSQSPVWENRHLFDPVWASRQSPAWENSHLFDPVPENSIPETSPLFGLVERVRSRSRSPLRKGASSPKTPTNQHRVWQEDRDSPCFARPAFQDQKVCSSPKLHEVAIAASTDAERMQEAKSPKSIRKRRALFTLLVSRELKARKNWDRVTKGDLESSLLQRGFDSEEIADGLQRLDQANKIMIYDNLVFHV